MPQVNCNNPPMGFTGRFVAPRAEMNAFDKLPRRMRDVLNALPISIDSQSAAVAVQRSGTERAIQILLFEVRSAIPA